MGEILGVKRLGHLLAVVGRDIDMAQPVRPQQLRVLAADRFLRSTAPARFERLCCSAYRAPLEAGPDPAGFPQGLCHSWLPIGAPSEPLPTRPIAIVAVAKKLIIIKLLLPVGPKRAASRCETNSCRTRTCDASIEDRSLQTWEREHLAGRSLHSQLGLKSCSVQKGGMSEIGRRTRPLACVPAHDQSTHARLVD